MQTTEKFSNPEGVLASVRRAALFLLPSHDDEAARAEAMRAAEADILRAVAQLVRAGRDDLAHRAAELAADAR